MAGFLTREPELCPHLAPCNLTVLPFTEAETICLEHINSSQTTCQNICEHLMAGRGWQKWRHHSYRQWQISCGRFCSAEDRRRQDGTERKAALPPAEHRYPHSPHPQPPASATPSSRAPFAAKHLGILTGRDTFFQGHLSNYRACGLECLFSLYVLYMYR